jgi:hypothetical protein
MLILEQICCIAKTAPCKDMRMMNKLRKGQVRGIEKRDSMKQEAFIASLFAVANEVEQEREIARPKHPLRFLQHNQ